MPEQYQIFGRNGFLGSNMAAQLEHSRHEVIPGDRDGNVDPDADYIIDCQSYGNYHWQTDQREIWKANVDNLVHMLESCGAIRGFLYLSSSSVLLDKQTVYSTAKREGEGICRTFAQEKPVVVMRPSSITGPGEQKEHLIPKLIESCLTGKEMPFVGGPTHDYVDVRDAAAAAIVLVGVAQAEWGRALNVSSGRTVSNEEVLAIVEDYARSKANIKRVPKLREYDTKKWQVHNNEILKLGWRPQYSLEDSIEDMVSQFYPGV